jgi:hypothetical protein
VRLTPPGRGACRPLALPCALSSELDRRRARAAPFSSRRSRRFRAEACITSTSARGETALAERCARRAAGGRRTPAANPRSRRPSADAERVLRRPPRRRGPGRPEARGAPRAPYRGAGGKRLGGPPGVSPGRTCTECRDGFTAGAHHRRADTRCHPHQGLRRRLGPGVAAVYRLDRPVRGPSSGGGGREGAERRRRFRGAQLAEQRPTTKREKRMTDKATAATRRRGTAGVGTRASVATWSSASRTAAATSWSRAALRLLEPTSDSPFTQERARAFPRARR